MTDYIRSIDARDCSFGDHFVFDGLQFVKIPARMQTYTVIQLYVQLEIAKKALQFYADGTHIMQESLPGPGNICDPIGTTARKALLDILR